MNLLARMDSLRTLVRITWSTIARGNRNTKYIELQCERKGGKSAKGIERRASHGASKAFTKSELTSPVDSSHLNWSKTRQHENERELNKMPEEQPESSEGNTA